MRPEAIVFRVLLLRIEATELTLFPLLKMDLFEVESHPHNLLEASIELSRFVEIDLSLAQ